MAKQFDLNLTSPRAVSAAADTNRASASETKTLGRLTLSQNKGEALDSVCAAVMTAAADEAALPNLAREFGSNRFYTESVNGRWYITGLRRDGDVAPAPWTSVGDKAAQRTLATVYETSEGEAAAAQLEAREDVMEAFTFQLRKGRCIVVVRHATPAGYKGYTEHFALKAGDTSHYAGAITGG